MLISPCLGEPLYVGALSGRSPFVGGVSALESSFLREMLEALTPA